MATRGRPPLIRDKIMRRARELRVKGMPVNKTHIAKELRVSVRQVFRVLSPD